MKLFGYTLLLDRTPETIEIIKKFPIKGCSEVPCDECPIKTVIRYKYKHNKNDSSCLCNLLSEALGYDDTEKTYIEIVKEYLKTNIFKQEEFDV